MVGRDVGFRSPNRDCPDENGTVGKYANHSSPLNYSMTILPSREATTVGKTAWHNLPFNLRFYLLKWVFKDFHSTSEPRAPFSSLFLTAKMPRCRPARTELVKVQTQGKAQLGALRCLNMLKKGAEERKLTKTFWFRNHGFFGLTFTVRSEQNVFPSSFSCFLFFFCRTFSCRGKHQSPAWWEQHQFHTRSVGQAWP